jgi:hypothetical protein
MKAVRFKIIPGLLNQTERFAISEIEEFAFIRRINARDDFRARCLVVAARALMVKPVDHDLVADPGQVSQPGTKTGVGQRATVSMVIGNDEKRAVVDPVTRKMGENFLDLPPSRRSDVMDRDDENALHAVSLAVAVKATRRNS